MDFDSWAAEIHANNVAVGWWDNPDECIYQKMQLICTEIAEATEGERKNMMDDHLPTRKMAEVELADALIRTLDLGGRLGLTYDLDAPWNTMCESDGSIGKQHLGINASTLSFAYEYSHWTFDGCDTSHLGLMPMSYGYSILIKSIMQVAANGGYDVESAMIEKLEYNKHRPDHKKENREAEEGKKF